MKRLLVTSMLLLLCSSSPVGFCDDVPVLRDGQTLQQAASEMCQSFAKLEVKDLSRSIVGVTAGAWTEHQRAYANACEKAVLSDNNLRFDQSKGWYTTKRKLAFSFDSPVTGSNNISMADPVK